MTDGHDHDELQLGHRSGLSAFADAVVRNPDGETSATTVRRRWADGQPQRAATRRHDLTHEKATRWWHITTQRLPEPVRVATSERADAVVAALTGLPPSSWSAAASTALRSTDWSAPDAAGRFVTELTRAGVRSHLDPPSTTLAANRVHARSIGPQMRHRPAAMMRMRAMPNVTVRDLPDEVLAAAGRLSGGRVGSATAVEDLRAQRAAP